MKKQGQPQATMTKKMAKISFREQMKGFPLWQMFVISCIRFSEPIAFTSLFPYVYFMIRDFNIAPHSTDIAKYSGYLSASFAFCQFFCCVQWGKASDKYGRKKILLMGLLGTAVSMIIFGFSPNFWVAVFARSLMGCLNGNIAVLRTAIGEIATHKNHQSIAFSTLPLLWNFGAVIGPIIGGSKYFTRPKQRNDIDNYQLGELLRLGKIFMLMGQDPQLPSSNDSDNLYNRFMNKYPYALSNIVIAGILMFSFIMGFLFLEETHSRTKNKRDIGLEIGDFILNKLGYETPTRPWQRTKRSRIEPNLEQSQLTQDSSDTISSLSSDDDNSNPEIERLIVAPQPLYNSVDGNNEDVHENDRESIDDEDNKYVGPVPRRYSDALVRRYSSAQLGPVLSHTISNTSVISTNVEQKFTRDIFTPSVVLAMTVNFFLSFHTVVYSEFLPVMLAGELKPDKLKLPFKLVGGFGYDSDTIGNLLSFTGLIGTLSVMFVFPFLDRHYRPITSLRASQIIFPILYPVLPYLVFTHHVYNNANPPWLTKTLLYVLCCILTASNAVGFPNIIVLIHRSSPEQHRAFINETSLSLNSLARFLGPMLWGYVMTISEVLEIGELSWILLGGLSLICCTYAFIMKDNEDDEDDLIAEDNV